MVILSLNMVSLWLWHQKTDLNYTGVLRFWTKQELSSVCDWYNTIFLPACHLELITVEFFRRYQNGICLWLYFLSASLSFNFYLCGGYIPCTSMFCMLLLLFFRFMLENVLVHTSILFTYVTMSQDISWAVHICGTSVLKNRKRPFKVASTFGTYAQINTKKKGC